MDAVLEESPFFDFGDDPLYPFPRTGLQAVDGDSTEQLREHVRRFAPREPGVYGMIDLRGRLVYVGKSKYLRNRLLSYFLPNNEEDKAGRIIQSAVSIVWETQPNEFAALLREQSLIRQFQPRFNVQGIPRRQQPIYVCLGRQPAEQLYTARQNDPKATSVIGPLFGSSRAGRAVEVLNRLFRLRDCSNKQPCSFTEQLQLFDIELRPGCIRLEIQSCLGPCISACSRGEYESQVAMARNFLSGKDDQAVVLLEKQMTQAAANLHFEQATVLREDLKAVRWLSRRTIDLAQARERYTFIYPVRGFAPQNGNSSSSKPSAQDVWYLVRRGLIEGAVAAPTTPRQRSSTTRLLKRWLAEDNRIGSQFAPRPETLALVTSWFRNHRTELKSTFLPTPPTNSEASKQQTSGSPAVKV